VVDPGSDDASLFARVLLGGHEVPDDALTEHWAAIGLWPSEPGWTCYLASVDGEAAGAAALALEDGIGYLANASTLPAGRRRGVQQALIERRQRDAAAAGCELTMALASPGSTSHRNLERGGLTVAFTEVFWTVPE
jgi:GNAT superfamily N-acetyltransferase